MYTAKSLGNPNIIYSFRDHDIRFQDGYAEDVPPEIAYQMSRSIRSGYTIEGAPMPYNPLSWLQDRRLVWSCAYASANGYGTVAENVVKALLKLGISIANPRGIGDMLEGGDLVDASVMQTLNRVITPDCIEIQHCQPHQLINGVIQRVWIYSMFETNHTPKRWIDKMNRLELVLVPSQWLVESWQEQGLTRPIEVFGHGVDTDYYRYLDRPTDRETFKFLHYGALGLRKGTDVVLQAFEDEFAGVKDVELILKQVSPIWPVPLGKSKVRYINATYSKQQMMNLLYEADCLVAPARGGGFELAPLEAMATGLTAIVVNWSGPTDYTSPEDTLFVEYRMMRSYGFDKLYESDFEPGETSGFWSEPQYYSLRERMRWAYQHRQELREMGKKASDRILRDWSWEAKVKNQLIPIINKYA